MFDLPDGRFVGVDKPVVRRTLRGYRFMRAQDRAVFEPILDLKIHCRTTYFLGHVLTRVNGPCLLLFKFTYVSKHLQNPDYFADVRAALSITAATSLGWEMKTQWLAPGTSVVWLLARLAYQRSRSGLMVRSLPATTIQLGLVLQAAAVIVPEKFGP